MQDKNKYMTPKYRLVVRITNAQIICQIVRSELDGDKVMAAAYSRELAARYGLKLGIKNYSAAYCTGLLVARRLLAKLGLGEAYEGNTEVTGEIASTEDEGRTFYVAELNGDKRPFRALLDVGIRATTTGARLFGALKGASDGGLDIPHTHKRFPGYERESDEYDASAHRDKIMGGHIAEYMRHLQEEDEAKFATQFAAATKAGLGPDDVEAHFEAVHAAIRANPAPAEKKTGVAHDLKYKRPIKRSLRQRKDRVRQKKASRLEKLLAAQ